MSLRHCRRGEGGSNEFNAIVTVQLYGLAHAMLRVHYSSCVLYIDFCFVSFPFEFRLSERVNFESKTRKDDR